MSFNKKITNKISNCFLMFLLMFCSFNLIAEKMPFKVFETESLSIKLSNDGTGIVKGIRCDGCDFNFVRIIVKGIRCDGCDFNFVRITADSKASEDGAEVSIMEARARAGKFVMVSFNPETQEVQYIRW